MASLRRSTVLPNDSATSRFLYTILKQLDHKSIDWNAVASDLEITNGHAARMRFSRFKQHMEGIPPTPRKPRSDARQHKKAKTEKNVKAEGKPAKAEKSSMKSEPMEQQHSGIFEDEVNHGFSAKEEPLIKPDPFSEPGPLVKPEPSVKPEPLVKEEPMEDWLYTAEEEDSPTSGLSSDTPMNMSPSIIQQPIMKTSTSPEALPKPTQVHDYPPVLKPEPHAVVKLEHTDVL
ncbi:hypothetical protein MMC11_001143 [Xylographa trunciseda]|nr:hypothetical protein [Xylographa trunciseda]